jgi:transaldolase/glucose-6-phosphate isomerase
MSSLSKCFFGDLPQLFLQITFTVVNTVLPQTLTAFLDHGKVRQSLEENLPQARQHLNELEKLGIPIKQVTDQLEVEGVKAFSDAFTVLINKVEERRTEAVS